MLVPAKIPFLPLNGLLYSKLILGKPEQVVINYFNNYFSVLAGFGWTDAPLKLTN